MRAKGRAPFTARPPLRREPYAASHNPPPTSGRTGAYDTIVQICTWHESECPNRIWHESACCASLAGAAQTGCWSSCSTNTSSTSFPWAKSGSGRSGGGPCLTPSAVRSSAMVTMIQPQRNCLAGGSPSHRNARASGIRPFCTPPQETPHGSLCAMLYSCYLEIDPRWNCI